ncbi:Arc family DNA-binding protein [Raoultella ornithinolytica]|uniref:Arc family DNA-binding protein n=1 Tax=Raoultella ornithinolytica TaxID=54291 RepID=UPI001EEF4579|nr:Arc family DNA-binding protein [Raoultella ornithinolytica]EKW7680914.1 Arc family DNA-binding protein [Raoultella ornithinolytica]EKW7684509.1 Arc family DNA-binding protein [Raoultella ornithinolytica]ELN4409890.1 Arc family DNA-binding protein [Raoultella ornithinolytica]ELS0898765.1 Arc family DNA-binding protein [Raoultella ornithinolytica]MCF6684161.1 Arc family DNA-binding protein [Raoultella ornithinolytica]
MSREDPQLRIRLPIELKEKIEEVAKSNNRSMNAEIVQRLDQSFAKEVPLDKLVPAKEAMAIIQKAKEELSRVILKRTFTEINKKLKLGHSQFGIELDDLDLEGLDDDGFASVFHPTFTRLEELGYTVPRDAWDASGFMVYIP